MKDLDKHRSQMVDNQLIARGIQDPKLLEAMRRVPRHLFVEPTQMDQAYEDHPLSIGQGQTISQPYMVAIMTQCLELSQSKTVLEIGTGSGYQTAILSELSKEVFTMECQSELLNKAKTTLFDLGYKNIHYKVGDGTKGWPEANQKYDAIIVTAAAPATIMHLIRDLGDPGRMVLPVGERQMQMLKLYINEGGNVVEKDICGCVFVPLIGEYGWKK